MMWARALAQERWVAWSILALWLGHLLLYVWLVPPWQHYDEPAHFEYAALIREMGRIPTSDDQLPWLRRAIVASMQATGFFRNPAVPLPTPDLSSPNLSIGITEHGHPPLYYGLVALASLPFRGAPIVTQLYVARLCSVVFAIVLFGAAYLVLSLLTGQDWQLRCWVLAAMALQPVFADNMSAVNNDALANLVAVLIVLASVWFLQQPSWQRLVPGLLLLVLAGNVKRTLLIFALLLPLTWLIALPHTLRRRLLLFAGAGLVVVLIWLFAQPWQLADWSRTPPDISGYISARPLQRLSQPGLLPSDHTIAPLTGDVAFALMTAPGQLEQVLTQSVYPLRLREVAGQQVTLAAWMRADREGLVVSSPALQINSQVISRSLVLGTSWQRATITAAVPAQAQLLAVQLQSPLKPGLVLYDSLALVAGGTANLPGFDEPDGSFEVGLLGPTIPRNLLRNAGAERQIPPIPLAVGMLSGRDLDQPAFLRMLSSLFNLGWIAAVYPHQALLLFEGAWGVFGWGEVRVNSGWFIPLGALVLASLVGIVRFTWRLRWPGRSQAPAQQLRAWWFCLAAVILGWGTAMLRVHIQPFPGVVLWSFGRYTFVAMLPAMLVFITGVRELLPFSWRNLGLALLCGFLLFFALATALFLESVYRFG